MRLHGCVPVSTTGKLADVPGQILLLPLIVADIEPTVIIAEPVIFAAAAAQLFTSLAEVTV